VRRSPDNKVYKRVLATATAAGLIVLLHASLAGAFTVFPGVVEISVPAGGNYSGSFTVGNPADTAVKIRVTVEDWSSAQDGREIIKGEKASLGWFAFSPQELELGPNETDIVSYTVKLPERAEGEYAAMVYFGTVADRPERGIAIASRIGNAFYVMVKGTEVVKGELIDIAVTRTDPMNIRVTIENSGNIHIRPRGDITIRKKGLFLSEKDREPVIIPFNKAGFPVLPNRNHIFEARSKDVRFGLGWYSLEFEAEFDGKKLEKELKFKVERGGGVKTFPAAK